MVKKTVGAICGMVLLVCTSVYAGDTTLIGWTFEKSGGMQGWSCNGDLKDTQLDADGLSMTVCGRDPIISGPTFQKPLSVDQYVEIQLKSDTDGEAQLYWATDFSGKYRGISDQKSIRFALRGDSKFRTYRIYPFWHSGPELRRLRFDLPMSGKYTLRSLRVVNPAQETAASKATAWEFKNGQQGWRVVDTAEANTERVSLKQEAGQLVLRTSDPKAALASPVLAVDAKDHFYVSFSMATDRGTGGEVFAVSKDSPGRQSIGFPMIADGKMHTYNVDVGSLNNWKDEILLVGIRPSNGQGEVTTRFESISITKKPAGPVDLRCRYFGPRETLHRTDRPTAVTCLLNNFGGADAKDVALELKVASPDVQVMGESTKVLSDVQFAIPSETIWKLSCEKPGTYPVSLTIRCDGRPVLTKTTEVTFTETPTVSLKKSMQFGNYIPEPQPVKSKFDVATFYFPGWYSINRWAPIFDYPNRRPAMGWYDEANPECVDWQIKWAVEHGINLFMVDWYWNRGGQYLDHWLKEGLANAKFKKYLKWCVMWANHNAAGSHSVEDWKQVTQFWIDNYFGMEEYYRIDDRPVVVLWSPYNIRHDVKEAAKLYAMSQEMAKKAGYKGIYFVAMFQHNTQKEYELLAEEGYHGATSYHGFAPVSRKSPGQKYFDFQDVVEVAEELWTREVADSGTMDYFPAVDTGWDSRPWHKDRSLVFDNRTPEKFKALCQKAKTFAEANRSKLIMLGPWNEWGEGSYIEPYSEHGFGHLDVVREVFCPSSESLPGGYPPNLVPEDIGRGSYELPLPEKKFAWEFETEKEVGDWNASRVDATHRDGCFHGKAYGSDPVLTSPPIRNYASWFKGMTIRMRSNQDSTAQLFWASTTQQVCENNSIHFKVIGDGKFHEYTLDLASKPGWRGMINALRFDPVSGPGPEFDIDYIRLEKNEE